jgi:hypothetical protein
MAFICQQKNSINLAHVPRWLVIVTALEPQGSQLQQDILLIKWEVIEHDNHGNV